jgi:hypothetical protein
MTTTLATPRTLSPGARRLLRACGYDDVHVARLSRRDARFFLLASVLAVVAAVVCGVSLGYGATLTLGAGAAPAFALVGTWFVLNLLRLHHAGSGYPLHHPLAGIDRWRPAGAAVVVLFTLGAFFTQPLVLLLLRPLIDAALAERAQATAALQQGLGLATSAPVHGLIARTHAAWDHWPVATAVLSLALSGVVAAPVLLRRTGAQAVRLYESERWVAERMFVDDAWAENRDAVTAILRRTAPGFTGRLQVHHADPPYNTRPLVFGLDPALFVPGRVRFVRPQEAIEPPPLVVPPVILPPVDLPADDVPADDVPADDVPADDVPADDVPADGVAAAGVAPAAVAPAPPAPAAPAPAAPAPSPSAPPASTASAPSLSRPAWAGRSALDVGRLSTGDVRADIRAHIDFLTDYLQLSRDDVLRALAAAPSSTPLYAVFPQWTNVATILLRPASFALDAGLAPLIAVAVDKTPAQVERRLQASPPDMRVSAVFAPELARRLLRGKSS